MSTKITIKEIKSEHLVKNIPLGKIASALDQIKSVAVSDEIDYVSLEAIRMISLVQVALKSEFYLDIEDTVDIYKMYDKIVELSLYNLITDSVDNWLTFENIVDREIEKIEAKHVAEMGLNSKIADLIDMATITLDKVSDKKYVNSVIKTFLTNAPKELVSEVKNAIQQVKK